ncbi:MAG: tetratricopeptide repeat protein [Candidatus Neomarinimicrobiota bacterium]
MKSDGMKNLSIEELSKLIEKDSKNPDNYYMRAIAYKDKGMFDEAHGDIDQAISLNPNYAEYYFLKGLILWCDRPKDLFWLWRDKDEYGCMINSFNKAIELNPNVAKYYYFRGSVRNALLDPMEMPDNEILNDFSNAVKIDPKLKSGWIKLGDQNRIRGEYSKAVEAYTKAIEIEPDSISYEKRAKLFFILDEYEKAGKDFSIILKDKFKPEVLYNRAKCYLKAENFNLALSDFLQLQSFLKDLKVAESMPQVYMMYVKWAVPAYLSYIYLRNREKDLYENNLKAFISNIPNKPKDFLSIEVALFSENFISPLPQILPDIIGAIGDSCLFASLEQFYSICNKIFGFSSLEVQGLGDEDSIIKYLVNPGGELKPTEDFGELDFLLELKFPQYKFSQNLDFILDEYLQHFGNKGRELYTLNIKSLILENFFGDSIIPSKLEPAGELDRSGNEVLPDGVDNTIYEYQKPKSANTSDVILKSKLYIGILVKLNERIFQITEEKRRSDEDEKKEELARQAEHHRREKERMIQQYSHTLANTLYPNAIYEVANRLKSHIEFRRDARILTDAYLAETIIRNQGLLLQARNTGNPAEFQQLIRGDRLPEDMTEKAISIKEILNSSVQRIVARFLNADYRKLDPIRTQICARRGTTLDQLRVDFEENVFFNPNRSAIEWASANIGRIDCTLSPLWNAIRLRRDGYSEALLQGYFQELLFNALKYRDIEQDIWIDVRFHEEEIENRTFLVCEWENPYTQNVSISTGKGLEGIQNDLEMLNDIREKDKVFTWREENGKFQVTFRFLKDIFVPYKPKTELDFELLAKQLNKEKEQ